MNLEQAVRYLNQHFQENSYTIIRTRQGRYVAVCTIEKYPKHILTLSERQAIEKAKIKARELALEKKNNASVD